MKILKWLIGGLVLLLVVAVTGVAIFISTLDVEKYRGLIEQEAYKATGRELTLAGPIDFKLSLFPTLVVEDASLANATWGSRPVMVTLRRLELQAELIPLLSRTVRVSKLVLVEPDILIETKADGTGNWQFEPPAATGPAAGDDGGEPSADEAPARDVALGVDALVIENGTFTYRDGATGQENVIRISRFEASAPNTSSPIDLELAVDVNGRPLELDGTIGAVDAIGTEPYPLDLEITAGDAEVMIDGVVADLTAFDGVDLNISARGPQLADLAAYAGTELPPGGGYRVTLRFKKSGSVYSVEELIAALGGREDVADSDVAGTISVNVAGSRPRITADLRSGKLNLASIRGTESVAVTGSGSDGGDGQAAQGQGGGSRYLFTDEPLPFDVLRSVDADVKWYMGLLELSDKVRAQNVDLTLALAGGRLVIDPLDLDLYGGEIAASAAIDASARAAPVAINIDGNSIDYGTLLEVFGNDNSFAGVIDLDADLTGRGNSMRAIASSLNGPFVIQGENGTIDNRWLRAVTGGVTDILGPLFGDRRTSRLHCVLFTSEAQNGVVRVKGMALNSEVFTLFGGGIIDLRDETLDLSFDSGTRETAATSLVPPFTVKGTLKDPKVRPRVADAITGIARVLGSVNSLDDALAVFTGAAQGDGSGDGTSAGNSCVAALEAAREGGGASSSPATDATQGAADRLIEGVGDAIESGDPEALEDAAEDALEGIKGLFGR